MRWNQRDKRWGRIRLGMSPFFIGGHGCLLTCIAMATGITPDVLVTKLEFTPDGLILWNENNKKALRELGLEFIGRYRNWTTKSAEDLQYYCRTEDYVPIMEVHTRYSGNHWVLPIGRAWTYRGYGWASNDPWTGEREWKTVGMFAPYKKELGWLLFKRIK